MVAERRKFASSAKNPPVDDSDSLLACLYPSQFSIGVVSVFIPSIVPGAGDTVYLVEDDFGHAGRAFRETDAAHADRETTLRDLLSSQYHHPIRIVAFNTLEGWSRDVSYEMATELQRRADIEGRELGETLSGFIGAYTSPPHQLSLRLA